MLDTLSPAEVPVRLLAFKAVAAVEYAVYFRLDVDPKDAAVEEDSVFDGAMRAAPMVAWKDDHSLRFVSPMGDPMKFSRLGQYAPRRRAATLL